MREKGYIYHIFNYTWGILHRFSRLKSGSLAKILYYLDDRRCNQLRLVSQTEMAAWVQAEHYAGFIPDSIPNHTWPGRPVAELILGDHNPLDAREQTLLELCNYPATSGLTEEIQHYRELVRKLTALLPDGCYRALLQAAPAVANTP